ncbi:hypothetical protein Tco_0336415 [Tanacetum coccineum]
MMMVHSSVSNKKDDNILFRIRNFLVPFIKKDSQDLHTGLLPVSYLIGRTKEKFKSSYDPELGLEAMHRGNFYSSRLQNYGFLLICLKGIWLLDTKCVYRNKKMRITILTTNTPYPSRKIRHIRACTNERPQRKEDQYAEVLIRAIRLKKVMADKGKKSSMRAFAPNDKADYYSGITSITVNRKNAYELKGNFLDDLYNNAFSGRKGKDAVEHIEYYLKIIDPIKLPDVDHNKLRIVGFLISLTGGARRWLDKTEESITCWDIMGFKTYEDYKNDWIYEWNENVPWVYDKPWLDNGIWKEPKPVKYTSYHIGNSLHYQDLEWYKALKDSELKDEALRNKAIMEGLISDDESSNDYWKR